MPLALTEAGRHDVSEPVNLNVAGSVSFFKLALTRRDSVAGQASSCLLLSRSRIICRGPLTTRRPGAQGHLPTMPPPPPTSPPLQTACQTPPPPCADALVAAAADMYEPASCTASAGKHFYRLIATQDGTRASPDAGRTDPATAPVLPVHCRSGSGENSRRRRRHGGGPGNLRGSYPAGRSGNDGHTLAAAHRSSRRRPPAAT